MPLLPPEQTTRGRKLLDAIALTNAAKDRSDLHRVATIYTPNTEFINTLTGAQQPMPVPPPANATEQQRSSYDQEMAGLWPADYDVASMKIRGDRVSTFGTGLDPVDNIATRNFRIVFRVLKNAVQVESQQQFNG